MYGNTFCNMPKPLRSRSRALSALAQSFQNTPSSAAKQRNAALLPHLHLLGRRRPPRTLLRVKQLLRGRTKIRIHAPHHPPLLRTRRRISFQGCGRHHGPGPQTSAGSGMFQGGRGQGPRAMARGTRGPGPARGTRGPGSGPPNISRKRYFALRGHPIDAPGLGARAPNNPGPTRSTRPGGGGGGSCRGVPRDDDIARRHIYMFIKTARPIQETN